MSVATCGVRPLGSSRMSLRSSGLRFLLFALVVIMNLVEQAAAVGAERAVMDAGRPARVSGRVERLAAFAVLVVADHEVAADQIDFFPMVVHERRRGVDARREAQEPGATAHLARLVEIAGE